LNTQIKLVWKPLLAVIFWGASFIATKHALNELEPLAIIFLRQILGILFLLVIAIKRKRNFTVNLKDHGGIFILSLIAVLHLWIQVTGLQYTSASNTGWIIGITPVFMALLGIIFFKEKISSTQTFGIIIAFIGLIILISKGEISSLGFLSNKGDFLVLGSAFTWSVYSLTNKKVTVNYPPMMTILFLFIMMSIIIAPFTLNEKNYFDVVNLSLGGWTGVLFLGIFCSGSAYVLWAEALKEMPSTKVGAFLYIEPFVTVFIAWLLLHESITLLMLISGVIIIGGVVLVNRK